ncbi:MAG: glycosyltransferase family 39 protein [Anaerolineae bacterium]|nr:glycosyltransferase family 39 protein [Anaerolineae bacterium]
MRRLRYVAVYLLLLVLFAQVALAARRTSITLDEPLHIASGYACLLTGDYRLVEEHPPLLKMFQAAPLLLADPPLLDPREAPGWDDGRLIPVAEAIIVPYRPIEPLVFAARVPTMLLALLLAVLVYRWAADAFDARAGLFALALCAFDPNVLAHAGVAATDLGAAFALFASTYTFWRWLRQPTATRALLAGLMLGIGLGIKLTAALVLPVQGVLFLVYAVRGSRLQVADWRCWMRFASIWLMGVVTLWAIYRFEVGPLPGLPFPVPMPSHLLPLFKLQEHMREGHSAFLMGQNYHHGTWAYFPIAFALKTPPLTLALLLATPVGLALRRLSSPGWRDELALLALPILYFTLSLTSGINIGYRHLLPVLPFVFVWVGRVANCEVRIRNCELRIASREPKPLIPNSQFLTRHSHFPLRNGLLIAALTLYATTTLTLFPWHLAYFNIFAGGPDGGYRYLVDSNLDWGQTWMALHDYVDAHGIDAFGLSQYTINDPRAYGLDYTPLPPWPDAPPVLPRRFNPAPGIYAISSTTLQGVVVADSEMFDYFRNLEPTARIGHAMFVYEIDPAPPTGWAAQCTTPIAPLPADVLAEGLGQAGLRVAYFDCAQSWLYPEGNGWFVLARAYEGWGLAHARGGRLAYEQARPSALPPFSIYEWFGHEPPAASNDGPFHAAPGDWPPQQVQAEGTPLTAPVPVGGDLAFLGYTVEASAGAAVVHTHWQVTRTPQQPLSLMAHLLGSDGVPAAVADGLGVPTDQMQPGDVIVQRHVFEAAPGTYWLQVGAYTLPDVTRLPVGSAGDRLVVGTLEVTAP